MEAQHQISLSVEVNATQKDVFKIWMTSKGHQDLTGDEAQIEAKVGSKHNAWGDYITGEILEIEENRRVLMTWRTTEFPQHAKDSTLELLFQEAEAGCRITLNHWNLPSDQVGQYTSGWVEHYLDPIKMHFNT